MKFLNMGLFLNNNKYVSSLFVKNIYIIIDYKASQQLIGIKKLLAGRYYKQKYVI